jgi:hypothetical protein
MANFKLDDVEKLETLWFDFIRKTKALGLDFKDTHIEIRLAPKGVSKNSITNTIDCVLDNLSRHGRCTSRFYRWIRKCIWY